MAYTNVQSSGKLRSNTGATLSWTPGTAPTLNNLLTCRTWGWKNTNFTPGASDVKDSSGTPKTFHLFKAGTAESGANAAIYDVVVPSGLTTPLKQAAGATDILAVFDEWSGNDSTTPEDVANSNQSASNVTSGTSGTLNTGANAGLVLSVVQQDGAGTITITVTGTSFSQDAFESDNNNYQAGSADRRTSSVASQTGLQDAWTFSGAGTYSAVIGSFNASSGVTPTNETNEPEVGLEATSTAVKVGVGTARPEAGFSATARALKVGEATARAELGAEATGTDLKLAIGTAQGEVGYEATALGSMGAITTATAQMQLGFEATSVGRKTAIGTAQASAGLDATDATLHRAIAQALAELGYDTTGIGARIASATAQAEVGFRVVGFGVIPSSGGGGTPTSPYLYLVGNRIVIGIPIAPVGA